MDFIGPNHKLKLGTAATFTASSKLVQNRRCNAWPAFMCLVYVSMSAQMLHQLDLHQRSDCRFRTLATLQTRTMQERRVSADPKNIFYLHVKTYTY